MPHQEAVAGVDAVGELRRHSGTTHRHAAQSAAIDDVEEQPPVGPCRVARLEQAQVGLELDLPGSIAAGPIQVDDGRVGGMSRVDGEADEAVEAFIGAGLAEGDAPLVGCAPVDLHAGDGHGSLLIEIES